MDVWCYCHLTRPDALPIPDFDRTYVGGRILSFLSRFGDAAPVPVVFDDECVAGITRVVAYMLTEVLEMANRCFREAGEHAEIMPSGVRMAVYNDGQLRDRLQFSSSKRCPAFHPYIPIIQTLSRSILGAWDKDLLAGDGGAGGCAISGVAVVLRRGAGDCDDSPARTKRHTVAA